jgi:filamentous hemagglutinin family protein
MKVIASAIATTIFSLSLTILSPLRAQLIPDTTLEQESSTVNIQKDLSLIEGGATRGINLFHSFAKFNVNSGENVYFTNPERIENIFTRVTGGERTEIKGVLGVLGKANLFLLNPQGISFNSGASLNLSGSFFATTANSIIFPNNYSFSTNNSTVPPLLTINLPIGLQLGENNRNISSNTTLLQVPSEQNLTLLANNINLQLTILTAQGGKIEIGSVGEREIVKLVNTSRGLSLNYQEVQNWQDVNLNKTLIDTSGLLGGSIDIQGQNINLKNTGIFSNTYNNIRGANIHLKSSNNLELNNSFIATNHYGKDLFKSNIIFLEGSNVKFKNASGIISLNLGPERTPNVEAIVREAVFASKIDFTNALKLNTLEKALEISSGETIIYTQEYTLEDNEPLNINSLSDLNKVEIIKIRSKEIEFNAVGNQTIFAKDFFAELKAANFTSDKIANSIEVVLDKLSFKNIKIVSDSEKNDLGLTNFKASDIKILPNNPENRLLNALFKLVSLNSLTNEVIFSVNLQNLNSPDVLIFNSSNLIQQDGTNITINATSLDLVAPIALQIIPDPSRNFLKLQQETIQGKELLNQSCSRQLDNKFTIAGRGGLLEEPTELLLDSPILQDWRYETNLTIESSPSTEKLTPPIVETKGWEISDNGTIKLLKNTSLGYRDIVESITFNWLNKFSNCSYILNK